MAKRTRGFIDTSGQHLILNDGPRGPSFQSEPPKAPSLTDTADRKVFFCLSFTFVDQLERLSRAHLCRSKTLHLALVTWVQS